MFFRPALLPEDLSVFGRDVGRSRRCSARAGPVAASRFHRHGWIRVGNGGSYGMGRRERGAGQKGKWSRSRSSRLALRRNDERY